MSQLDTWDPKPEAPAEIRGPWAAIRSRADGILLSELFPRLAVQAPRLTLVRSVTADYPAVHELGIQAMETGGWSAEAAQPRLATVVSARRPAPVLPRPLDDLGLPGVPTGQSGHLSSLPPVRMDNAVQLAGREDVIPDVCGGLDEESRSDPSGPALPEEGPRLRERYGETPFGRDCLRARQLVERGTAFVTVNQFTSLFGELTWDCHGLPDLPTRVTGLAAVAGPFDRGVAALVADLADRGLLEQTLVCAVTEFGRTPEINSRGGRDHHTGCWSVMLAGGTLPGGVAIGQSDSRAYAPALRPVAPGEIAATILHHFGIRSAPAPLQVS